ncbi:HK97-gp10 family putative phage morphogenesis protein [Enterococcus sp. AZ050]|uniref:HK97-gp10 family putative phage morphogenesis protein n=1 Tax=Enterococcus sp. AZ050 TaxID=2774696 RepID=UPI003F20C6C4
MTYRVDISGLDDLIEAIEEAKKLDDVKEVVKNDTAYMANQIAEETPVRDGYLERSEVVSFEDEGFTGVVTAGGPLAPYAPYVEYGTRYFYGRFYMKKGHAVAAKRFLDNMEALVK